MQQAWQGRHISLMHVWTPACPTAYPPACRLHGEGVVAVRSRGQRAGVDLRQPLPEHRRMVPGAHAHGELLACLSACPAARLPAWQAQSQARWLNATCL
jgi:hypothetical protein